MYEAPICCDFRIIDISNPIAPVELATLFVPGGDLAVEGERAYVINEFEGLLSIIDVSIPTAPRVISEFDVSIGSFSLEVLDQLEFVPNGSLLSIQTLRTQ